MKQTVELKLFARIDIETDSTNPLEWKYLARRRLDAFRNIAQMTCGSDVVLWEDERGEQ